MSQEFWIAIFTVAAGSSVLTALITGLLIRKKTSAEAESISVSTADKLIINQRTEIDRLIEEKKAYQKDDTDLRETIKKMREDKESW